MEKEQRNRLQKATQDARKLLEEEFRSQLLQTYDIDVEKVRWAEEPGAHLQAEQRLIREKLVAWIEHKEAQINDRKEALLLALREMAFTALNRFVALKLMEARELVRPCVSGGLESAGFLEFTAVAQGLLADQESSYRLYLETTFEDVSRELRALFDPRDPASLLWPKRAALLELLDILNRPELTELWSGDETLGWVYQYFNGDAERKKMREESSAPRNSRELAVRNQFFTPRYVVEFLTDNTLGRIWYEMRQGNTGLKERCRYLVRRPNEIWLQPGEQPPAQADADEALSQEELLRQPVYITHRPLKDPREIRMLDPACGSMHFGLYAFDLYLAIYEEAWNIAKGSSDSVKTCQSFASFASYVEEFADKSSYLKQVPGLILKHNIHGVDVDPRATQIARLSLWLRAQRAWLELSIDIMARPRVARSNIACAEPMPGDSNVLADFVDQHFSEAERDLALELLASIVKSMQHAGEAGSLLMIEEEITDALNQAHSKWRSLALRQRDLFDTDDFSATGKLRKALETDLENLTQRFWVDIEDRIYRALRDYAERTESREDFRRRLFADDAAKGFALIDICRQTYDVVLMNPPFGDCCPSIKGYVDLRYTDAKTDLGMAFVSRWARRLSSSGMIGAITNRVFLANEKLSKWRLSSLFGGASYLETMADLGLGVLDAMVEAAAYVLSTSKISSSRISTIFRVLSSRAKDASLSLLVNGNIASDGSAHFVDITSFLKVPSSILCYWLPPLSISLLSGRSTIESAGLVAKQGMASGDDFRFFRLWWEVPSSQIEVNGHSCIDGWVPLAKGGEYSPLVDDPHLLVDWRKAGQSIKAYVSQRYPYLNGDWGWVVKNSEYYFRRGLTYPARTVSDFCPRVLPAGCIFSAKGQAILGGSDEDVLLYLFGSFTRFYKSLLEACLGSGDTSFSVGAAKDIRSGLLNKLPHPLPSKFASGDLVNEMREAILEARRLNSDAETTHYFASPLRDGSTRSLHDEACARVKDVCDFTVGMCSLNKRVESAQQLAYELPDNDWTQVCELSGRHPLDYPEPSIGAPNVGILAELGDSELVAECVRICGATRQVTKKTYIANRRLELISHATGANINYVSRSDSVRRSMANSILKEVSHSIISYGIGLAFGRWDKELGLKGRLHNVSSDIFSPLPVRAPGSLDNSQHTSQPRPVFLLSSTEDGSSLAEAVRSWIREYSPRPEDEEAMLCTALSTSSIGDYINKSSMFFAAHLAGYSKSRRQAPVYWQVSAGACSYSIWFCYQNLTSDALYSAMQELVVPRIELLEREQSKIELADTVSVEGARQLHQNQASLVDLRALQKELDLVAPLWNPNLNDGVIINHAILWRITPYTPWQKKCKECWDKLVKGDYDWAHLAFHLWPERVIPKCSTDRSLAIAHGLEERLWQETNNGNWLPRQLSEADLQALIAEHSNPAVKSALERFLAVPPPVAPTRTRASRSTRASGSSTPRRARGSAAVVDAEATRQVLLALTAAPSDGLAKTQIADLIGVETNAITAVIKQLKESGQIDQLGERRGARYVLSEQGRAAVASQAGEDD